MSDQRLYYGGHQYGYFAYGSIGIPIHEGSILIQGNATVTWDGFVSSTLDQLQIVGRAFVLVNGVRETYGGLSIVGKAQLTSTISYVGVIPVIEVIQRGEHIVITVGGKTAEITITDLREGRIKPVVATNQSKPKMSVIAHTTSVEPLHRGAEITYQIERSEEFIYAD